MSVFRACRAAASVLSEPQLCCLGRRLRLVAETEAPLELLEEVRPLVRQLAVVLFVRNSPDSLRP
jgi:hypothetical protein